MTYALRSLCAAMVRVRLVRGGVISGIRMTICCYRRFGTWKRCVKYCSGVVYSPWPVSRGEPGTLGKSSAAHQKASICGYMSLLCHPAPIRVSPPAGDEQTKNHHSLGQPRPYSSRKAERRAELGILRPVRSAPEQSISFLSLRPDGIHQE
jgi:hypothetical protein